MLLQAPIIGVMLALVFGGQKDAIPVLVPRRAAGARQRKAQAAGAARPTSSSACSRPPITPAAIFFLVVAAVWFGTSNAAREIVSERAHLPARADGEPGALQLRALEVHAPRAASASSSARCCSASSFFALGFNGGPQAFLLELGGAHRHVDERRRARAPALDGRRLGAKRPWRSRRSRSSRRSSSAGSWCPMTTNPMLKSLMYVMPARWGFQGVDRARAPGHRAADPAWVIDLQNPTLNLADDFVKNGQFQLRHRADRERHLQRRVGLRPVRIHLAALRGARRDDARHVGVHLGNLETPRPDLKRGRA